MKKRCTKCGVWKDLTPDNWYKDSGHKDGFQSSCKECNKKVALQWRKNNLGRARELDRQWRKNNPEKVREQNRRWGKNNPGKGREAFRRWQKREIAGLGDFYVKDKIRKQYKIPDALITGDMIEIKRKQLIVFREIKKAREELKNGID